MPARQRPDVTCRPVSGRHEDAVGHTRVQMQMVVDSRADAKQGDAAESPVSPYIVAP